MYIVANWKDKEPDGGIDNWVKSVSEVATNHRKLMGNNLTVIVCPRDNLINETKAAIEKYGNVIELGKQDLDIVDPYDDMPNCFV